MWLRRRFHIGYPRTSLVRTAESSRSVHSCTLCSPGRLDDDRHIRQVYCTAADTFTLIRLLRRAEVIRLQRQHAADGQTAVSFIYQQNLFNVEHTTEAATAEHTEHYHVLSEHIENVDSTRCILEVITLFLPCFVSEILQVFRWEQRPHPYSTRILGCSPWTRSLTLGLRGAKTLS